MTVTFTFLIPMPQCEGRYCGVCNCVSTHSVVHLVVAGDVLVQGAQHDHGHHARQEHHNHQGVQNAATHTPPIKTAPQVMATMPDRNTTITREFRMLQHTHHPSKPLHKLWPPCPTGTPQSPGSSECCNTHTTHQNRSTSYGHHARQEHHNHQGVQNAATHTPPIKTAPQVMATMPDRNTTITREFRMLQHTHHPSKPLHKLWPPCLTGTSWSPAGSESCNICKHTYTPPPPQKKIMATMQQENNNHQQV